MNRAFWRACSILGLSFAFAFLLVQAGFAGTLHGTVKNGTTGIRGTVRTVDLFIVRLIVRNCGRNLIVRLGRLQ